MALGNDAFRHLNGASCMGELAFIQQCLRRKNQAGQGESRPVLSGGSLSPDRIFEISRLNKVAHFVAMGLPEDDATGVLAERLDGYRRKTIVMNAATMNNMLAVNRALRSAGLEFVFLKGPLQQKMLYGDFFMKPSGDVDVLVSPDDFVAARNALGKIGFRPAAGSRSLWWTKFLGEQHLTGAGLHSVTVDLHHRLQQPGSPSPRSPRQFLSSRRSVDCAGEQVPFPSLPHMVLLTCISIVKAFYNHEPCGDHVCDLRAGLLTLSGAEQQDLLHHAEEQGLRDTLLVSARAVDVLLGHEAGHLASQARRLLAGTDDEDIRDMILAPWLSTIAWPKRRAMLWALCGERPLRYISEAGWAASAELSRRLLHRTADM